MSKVEFKCLLKNAAFLSNVSLSSNSLALEIADFQCDFQIFSNGIDQTFYSCESPGLKISYSKFSKILGFDFSIKEMTTNGRAQLHDLNPTIEKHLGSMLFHTLTISSQLEDIINGLSQTYRISIRELTHENSTVAILTKNNGVVLIKTSVKSVQESPVVSMSSNILTTVLFEHYCEMKSH